MDKSGCDNENPRIGGQGSKDNPYIIKNSRQLQQIEDNLESHFILGCNVDASETKLWNDGKGFKPIGSDQNRFTGTFSGNGYKIENLYINRPETDNVGLFGVIGYKGLIEDVIIQDFSVHGQHNVSALVACNKDGDIINCEVKDANVLGSHIVGGAIGWNAREDSVSAKICSHNTVVKGKQSVGCVIGENEGHIYEICANDSVSIGKNHAGNIVGFSTTD